MMNGSGVRLRIVIAVLFAASALASCGGGSTPAPSSYAITATSGAHGTITPAGVTTFSPGASTTYTITPDAGYIVASLTVDGRTAAPTTSYTFTNVRAAHAINATFILVASGYSADKATILAEIAAQKALWAAEPVRGTVTHYCDCAAGSDASCVAGSDTTGDGSAANPFRSFAYVAYSASTTYATGDLVTYNNLDYVSLMAGNLNHSPGSNIGIYWQYVNSSNHAVTAISRYNGLTGINTIAFCKGGAHNSAGVTYFSNTSCAAGTTCVDFREYASPNFTSAAKPILNHNHAGTIFINIWGGTRGGIRFLNLDIRGNSGGAVGDGTDATMLLSPHDVVFGNVDFSDFDGVLHVSGNGATSPETINPGLIFTGNTLTDIREIAVLGAGYGMILKNNYFNRTGGTNTLNHAIYTSSTAYPAMNVLIEGNYIYSAYANLCQGVVITGHGQFVNLRVDRNYIEIPDAAYTNFCYGISLGSGGYLTPSFYRTASVSQNTIINGGNTQIGVAECTDCIIENNQIINTSVDGGGVGVLASAELHRPAVADDVNARVAIRNNTIWSGPAAHKGLIGIQLKNEGTDYVVANNTVTYMGTDGGIYGGVRCFQYDLGLASSAYAFIDNNHCYSATPTYKWETTNGLTLSAWKTYSGFDTSSISGTDPKFTNPGTDFTPMAGSPLSNAGSSVFKPVIDYLGNVRGGIPAIGAIE